MDIQHNKLIEDYWHARLRDMPRTALFASRGIATPRRVHRPLAPGVAARLRAASKGSALGVAILGMTTLALVLRAYARCRDLVLALAVADGEARGNRVLCRVQLDGGTVADALAAVKATVQDALAHGGYPHDALRARLDQRGAALPAADALAAFHAAALHAGLAAPDDGALTFVLDDADPDAASVAIVHRFGADPLIERLATAWAELLARLPNELATPLAALRAIGDAERAAILDAAHTDARWDSRETVASLFAAAVRAHGARPAVTFEGETLSYAELDDRVLRLAAQLRAAGAARGDRIAVIVERSLDLVVAMLAVVRAGAAYVPIDPELPEARARFILEDSGARVVIASQVRAALAPDARWISLAAPLAPPGPLGEVPPISEPADLLYVIYTSGTTGQPKGVLVEHRNVVRLLFNDRFQFAFGATDVWTLFHAASFDFSVWEMYGALLRGGRLVVVPTSTARDPAAFVELLARERVSVLNQTPSAFLGVIEAERARGARLAALRYVIFGGEALDPGKLAAWHQRYPDVALINMYGITETTVHVTYKQIGAAEIAAKLSNIGRAIPTLSTYIVDDRLQLAPIGVPGELCVGGAGVARGYLDRDALTAERFIADPFGADPFGGGRLYRSGDLARMLDSGELEYLGRIDAQVKVRGFRIETREIEAQLEGHPGVARAVVIARQDDDDASYLCAYVVLRDPAADLDADALRAHAAQFLPAYMVPAYVVAIDAIPLTGNGKLDRAALPDPRARAAATGPALQGLHGPHAAKLAAIWTSAIGDAARDADRSFFEAGGDSIRAIRLIGAINDAFGTQLRIPDLYRNPSLAQLAALIEDRAPRDDERAAVIAELDALRARALAELDAVAIDDVYPASDMAQAMVFHGLQSPGDAVYHDQLVYQFAAPVFEPARFQRALALLAERHEVLRARFVLDSPDGALQIIERAIAIAYAHDELAALDRAAQSDAVRAWLAQDRAQPFAPAIAPLWRAHTFGCGGDRVALVLVAHHAILDGWSASRFVRELGELYHQLALDPAHRPAPLASRHREHIIHQRLAQQRAEAVAFWRDELAGFVQLDRFAEARRGTGPSSEREHALPAALVAEVHAAARAQGLSVKTLCLTAYLEALAMFNYHADFVVGLVTHDRPACRDGDLLLGCFLNTVPLRVRLPAAITHGALARRIDASLRALEPHAHLPLSEIVRATGEDARDGNPLFATFFNYTDFGDDAALATERALDVAGRVRTDTLLDVTVDATGGRLQVIIGHVHAAFAPDEAARLCAYFERALRLIAASPDAPAHKLALMADDERRRVVGDLDARVPLALGASAPAAFAAQVARTPARRAVVAEDGALTYAQLASRVAAFAGALRAGGVARGDVVGLLVERSLDLVISVLAINAAGAAYLPFDPELPDARIDEVLALVAPTALVATATTLAGRALRWLERGRLVRVDRVEPAGDLTLDVAALEPRDLLYLISTSGSTGQPKCVMVEHLAILNLAQFTRAHMALPDAPKVLQLASIGFDVSAQEIYTTLLLGGELHLIPPGTQRDVPRLLALIERRGVEVVYLAPALLDALFADAEQAASMPRCVRHFVAAGEALVVNPQLARAVREGRVALHNHYGPSETHVVTAIAFPAGSDVVARPPIGAPLPNVHIFVLDENGHTQPLGAPGELFLGGDPVGRGYYGRDALTAERFTRGVPDRHAGAGDLRVYRSGDLGCWNADGTLSYLGRIDQQVKIRGYRVELGEIEQRLRALAGIHEVVVLDVDDGGGRRSLAAFVVPSTADDAGDAAVARWRGALARQLPSYMVPATFVAIPAVPLTRNGKIDRRRLRALSAPSAPAATDPITDPIAARLAELWAATLAIEPARLDASADFFALGGHSLKAMLLTARVQRTLGVAVPIRALYEAPTLGAMADYVRAGTIEPQAPIAPQPPRERDPASPAQQRFFVLHALDRETVAYNVPLTVELAGAALEVPRLAAALQRLTERHAALRTRFVLDDGVVYQQVVDAVEVPVEVVACADREVAAHIARFVRPFALDRAPLMRALIMQLAPDRAVVTLDFHHIVLDGFSTGILLREALRLYAGEALPPPRVQYRDYVGWLASPAQQARREAHAAFWLARFAGELPVLELPVDRPRPPVRDMAGGFLSFALPPEVVGRWRQLARDEGASLFMVCLAAFHLLLTKLTGQDRTVIGTPVAGRNHADLEDVVGAFVNTLALDAHVDPQHSFRALLGALRDRTLEAFEHQDYPFEALVERRNAARDTSRNPLYDAFLAFHNMDLSAPPGAALTVAHRDPEIATSKFDLSLFLTERDGGLAATFEYATALFDASTIARFARYFTALARQIADAPDAPVARLELLEPDERAAIDAMAGPLAHIAPPAGATLPALFAASAARFADRPAVTAATGETLTYAAFAARVQRLAAALVGLGVVPGAPVVVRLDRSIEHAIAAYAVLQIGGVNVPVSPHAPAERTAFMLRDSGARIALGLAPAALGECTQYDVRALIDEPGSARRGSAAEWQRGVVERGGAPVAALDLDPEAPAYYLYTSGSTGTPKAVVLPHRTLVSEVLALQRAYPLGAEGVYLHKTAITFDMSVAELFGWFHAGGQLAILAPGDEGDPLRIAAAIERGRVTHLNFVPSMFGAWVEGLDAASAARLASARYIFLGGEVVQPAPVRALNALCPWIEIHNVYGPTEGTYVSGFPLAAWSGSGEIPVGAPLAGVRVRIIDRHGNLAPIGVVGELAIGGHGLSHGYLGRPELTAEKFVRDRFGTSGLLYRSGDAARWRLDGNIEYRGRIDQQVKIRGFRVELGEVEAVMRRCAGVQDAVAAVRALSAGASLCGYFVPADGASAADVEAALRAALVAALPDYMIPSHLIALAALPLNASGKADRLALPAPEVAPAARVAYVAPGEGLEQTVAAAWARVLGAERVGLDDNFFELGGTSLAVVRLQTLLRDALGRDIAVATLFRFPTVRAQATHLAEPSAARSVAAAATPADLSRLLARRKKIE